MQWVSELIVISCRVKESEEQLDDRIIEVCWNTERGTWKMLRIRDDKPHANHKSIMEKILISIEDGVELEAVSYAVSILQVKVYRADIFWSVIVVNTDRRY